MTLVQPLSAYNLHFLERSEQLMSFSTKHKFNCFQFQSLTALNKSLARNQRQSTFDIIFERKPKNPI
ncbi:hypothetical protein SAMN00777080_3064 [Aquiflexum balticum DSM 16537]|uniref:Uncharacterized protein n=1 Tax=Aquiflexum balticum DSM 16537 TaxID=758820 RepID=A0A1W2H6A5_9BACT|nr:hypothetical protein SAMN00777080_3064 [Aquiflexum balticum DSM 16537]